VSTALAQAPPADETRRLYEEHSSRIFGFCLSRLGSREEAEDAVQTTFMNAQRGLGRGVVPEYELAWLFKIAQNVCHNRHQSTRRRRRLEAVQDLDSVQDAIASPERSSSLSLGELTHALGAIPQRQRQALLLREFQGLSYEEIADELGLSVSAVETLLFRARRSVAQQLEQTGATPARRRSAVASVVELFRWLFGGGAAPLKIAAVTAAVATTATVAAVPLTREKASAPTTPAIVSTPHTVAPVQGSATTKRARRVVPSTPTRTTPLVTDQAVSSGESTASPAAATPKTETPAPNSNSQTPKPVSTPTAPQLPVPAAQAQSRPLPEVSVPAVTVPEVQLPDVKLPTVQLPPVQLPVQLPKLPVQLP
jgi:RNA polymerase sigma-70 factor, ECF subfamily